MKGKERRRRTGSLQCEKNGVWTMRVSLGGKVYSQSSGTKDNEKAKRELAKFVVDIECKHPCDTSPGLLLKEWPRYENSIEAVRLSPGMRGNRFRMWRYFSLWMKSAYPKIAQAKEVTRQMAEEYMSFFGEKRSALSFNLCVGHLKGIFRVLLGRDGEEKNPWNWIVRKFSDSRSRRELSADEVRRIFVSADREGGEWPRLIAIATYTGLRLGDCCRLRWENVNIEHGIIQLVPNKTKRYACGRPITIPIHDRLLCFFTSTPRESRSGFVMPEIAEKYEIQRWRITKGLNKIFDCAGISRSIMYEGRGRLTPYATFHSLRHSFVSFAANAGVPLVVVQAIVGHTSTAMTHHYYHANEAALRRAVNAIPSFNKDSKYTRKTVCFNNLSAFDTYGRRQRSVADRLRRIEKLFTANLISTDEHSALRERILADA